MPSRTASTRLAAILGVSLATSLSAAAADFILLGDLPRDPNVGFGAPSSSPSGLSPDGRVVVGVSFSPSGPFAPFRWTPSTGMQPLSNPSGRSATVQDVSADGQAIIGRITPHAQLWRGSDDPISLGDLPGGIELSTAWAMTPDGRVVVGSSESTDGTEAFRWTEDEAMVGLGDLPGGEFSSSATGVSADGSVIVGQAGADTGAQAFRWTPDAGMVSLHDPQLPFISTSASAVSADGSTVIGTGRTEPAGLNTEEGLAGFVWTAEQGMVRLGRPPGPGFTAPTDVSADGSVIVGVASDTPIFGNDIVVWNRDRQMRTLASILTDDFGIDLGGIRLTDVARVSDDGLTITGVAEAGLDRQVFIAHLDPSPPLEGDLNFDGFVGAGDLDILLGQWNTTAAPAVRLTADVTSDGVVGASDLDALLNNWNAARTPAPGAAAIPEPAAVLPLTLLSLLARRRAGSVTSRRVPR